MAKWTTAVTKGATSVQTIMALNAAAAASRRAKVNFYNLGCSATPADATFDHIVQRCTTPGTGTAVTPNAKDPADTLACTIQSRGLTTVDPTLTAAAFLNRAPFNQRLTYQWMCAPGDELLIPAVANAGIIIGLSTASTVDFSCAAHFDEQ